MLHHSKVPQIPILGLFILRLSTGAVRCQCVDVGVQIIILMQIWHGDDMSLPLR